MQLAASIGFYKMTNLSEAQKEVLANPEFEHFKVDYDTYFQQTLKYLLQGPAIPSNPAATVSQIVMPVALSWLRRQFPQTVAQLCLLTISPIQ